MIFRGSASMGTWWKGWFMPPDARVRTRVSMFFFIFKATMGGASVNLAIKLERKFPTWP